MTSEQSRQIEKWVKKKAILAHKIAEQVAAVEGITYQGAFEILDLAKRNLERGMKEQSAKAPAEIRDEVGRVFKDETPRGETRGET